MNLMKNIFSSLGLTGILTPQASLQHAVVPPDLSFAANLIKAQNNFLLRFTQQVIATTGQKTSNLVFSPALNTILLSCMAARSPEAIADKILFSLKASSTTELNALSSKIVTYVLADSTSSGGPTISAANGFWIDKSLHVDPSFKDLLENSYKAAFNQVDFRTKAHEVTREVNSWVKKQTKGLITDLLSPDAVTAADTDHIFANALFFKGKWETEFRPSLTKDSDFHLLDGTKVPVPFMMRDGVDSPTSTLYLCEGFRVLDLPYKRGQDGRSFSMQIYLPDEKDGLPALLERLATTSENFEDIPRRIVQLGVLKIPKFKFSFDFEATKALKGLGLEVPLSRTFHKACIEVDEEGTKAAAAAAVIGSNSCARARPVEKYDFVADHPFLFLIKEHNSGLHLFFGQVTDPSQH